MPICIRALAGGGSNTSRSSTRRRASHSRRSNGMQYAPHIWWSPSHMQTGTTVKASHARCLEDCFLHTCCLSHLMHGLLPCPEGHCSAPMHPSCMRACYATLQLRVSSRAPPAGPGRVLHSHLLHAKLLHVHKLPCPEACLRVRIHPFLFLFCHPAAVSQQLHASCRSGG